HIGRTVGVTEGKPQLEDGCVVDVSTVVWCTGFRPNYEFLDLPSLPWDAKGLPVARHGIAEQIPGLYFIGLPFQVGLTSTLVGGAGRDAALVVRHIGQQRKFAATRRSAQLLPGKPAASAPLLSGVGHAHERNGGVAQR